MKYFGTSPKSNYGTTKNSSTSVPHYRTIKNCLKAIKAIDKDSAISEWFIRQLCKSNKIAYFSSGNKSLVNLDSLLTYLGFNPNISNSNN